MVNLLERYRQKRDFRHTSEPVGKRPRKPAKAVAGKGGLFVVHKHDARRLHYDLRLEHDGILWSWAVTRGPSLDPSEKRLAVHVEDHPLDYARFEGEIPRGSYGAGTVIVWDRGTWRPDGDPAAGIRKGHLDFELSGSKLKGRWHLVRLTPREKEKRDNWLLIKSQDEFANAEEDILETAPLSVKSGLGNQDIQLGEGSLAKKEKKAKGPEKRAQAARMPAFIPPALAMLVAKPPDEKDWVHEVKFDGYRMQARVSGGGVTLYTRSGLDWTRRFGPELRESFLKLKLTQAIIDGEIVVLSDAGIAAFPLLQADLSSGRTDRMVYYAFDLLFLDGQPLLDEPMAERKSRLRDLLAALRHGAPLRYSEHFNEAGETMLEHACRLGLEGVVSKRLDAPYRSGRSLDWVKSKCTLRQEFVIIGYVPSEAAGRGIRSLIVAYRKDGRLVHAGRVGTGFSTRAGDELKRALAKLKAPAPAVKGLAARERTAVWVRPKLVAEVEFRAWTAAGILRQASFLGLREDKQASEIVKEKAVNASSSRRFRRKPSTRGNVLLGNAAKLLWPKAKISKQNLLDYYESVWPWMERFIINRPLSLLRAPDGIDGQRFFQKHASPGMPDAIATRSDPKDKSELLYIRNFEGLAALVQLATVEIHVWGASVDAIETPDHMVFDLDPDESVAADTLRQATLEVRMRLQEMGLPSCVKTSGGKGFHVAVPLKPKAVWEDVKTFAHDFADAMAQAAPDKYTATLSKRARKGRIFIDYLRNGRGSTTIAPFSTRANDKAAISAPVEWRLLKSGITPQAFSPSDGQSELLQAGYKSWVKTYALARPLP